MEHWPALVLKGGNGMLRRSHLQAARIPAATSATLSVWVAANSDLEAWARTVPSDALQDRRRKHPSRPLSAYLPPPGGCARLMTDYRDPGQAERGLRALVRAAGEKRRGGLMLVGVDDELLTLLRARAPQEPDAYATLEASSEGTSPEGVSDVLRDLLNENPKLKVPARLVAEYLGSSESADWVRKLIVLAARCAHPVLVEGETGTGKEIVARQIHNLSERASQRFLVVNCGGIPEELLESELFGHVRGAFTGALRDKQGLWTLADGGTLFLDEIGDLSPRHQVKVLRAVEDGCYRPVGSEIEVRSDARIIAATHRDLRAMVDTGRFREDLYYRLFALRIRTPSLREHPGDIPELARHFWGRVADRQAAPLPVQAIDELRSCGWPGNVRELRAFLTNLAVFVDGRPPSVSLVRALLRDRRGLRDA